jgi:hypothetical protein
MIKRFINKLLFSIYGEDTLITKEGWLILNDPVMKKRLREMIENYHKTGEWDFRIMDDDCICYNFNNSNGKP